MGPLAQGQGHVGVRLVGGGGNLELVVRHAGVTDAEEVVSFHAHHRGDQASRHVLADEGLGGELGHVRELLRGLPGSGGGPVLGHVAHDVDQGGALEDIVNGGLGAEDADLVDVLQGNRHHVDEVAVQVVQAVEHDRGIGGSVGAFLDRHFRVLDGAHRGRENDGLRHHEDGLESLDLVGIGHEHARDVLFHLEGGADAQGAGDGAQARLHEDLLGEFLRVDIEFIVEMVRIQFLLLGLTGSQDEEGGCAVDDLVHVHAYLTGEGFMMEMAAPIWPYTRRML